MDSGYDLSLFNITTTHRYCIHSLLFDESSKYLSKPKLLLFILSTNPTLLSAFYNHIHNENKFLLNTMLRRISKHLLEEYNARNRQLIEKIQQKTNVLLAKAQFSIHMMHTFFSTSQKMAVTLNNASYSNIRKKLIVYNKKINNRNKMKGKHLKHATHMLGTFNQTNKCNEKTTQSLLRLVEYTLKSNTYRHNLLLAFEQPIKNAKLLKALSLQPEDASVTIPDVNDYIQRKQYLHVFFDIITNPKLDIVQLKPFVETALRDFNCFLVLYKCLAALVDTYTNKLKQTGTQLTIFQSFPIFNISSGEVINDDRYRQVYQLQQIVLWKPLLMAATQLTTKHLCKQKTPPPPSSIWSALP